MKHNKPPHHCEGLPLKSMKKLLLKYLKRKNHAMSEMIVVT